MLAMTKSKLSAVSDRQRQSAGEGAAQEEKERQRLAKEEEEARAREATRKQEEELAAAAAKAAQAAAEKRTTEANDSSPLSICLRCICGGLCAHVCAAAQAESGSGLRHTADELRKELESVRANMTGAIPAAAHNLMLSELKQVMHTPGPLFPLLLACSSCCSCRGACPALLSCALDLVHARSAESA